MHLKYIFQIHCRINARFRAPIWEKTSFKIGRLSLACRPQQCLVNDLSPVFFPSCFGGWGQTMNGLCTHPCLAGWWRLGHCAHWGVGLRGGGLLPGLCGSWPSLSLLVSFLLVPPATRRKVTVQTKGACAVKEDTLPGRWEIKHNTETTGRASRLLRPSALFLERW